MNKQIMTAMTACVLLAEIGSSSALAQRAEVVARVPFEFRAGSLTIESGAYRISTSAGASTFLIRSAATRKLVEWP
jgi:hypothetical protein